MPKKMCCSRCGGTIREQKFARQPPADVDPGTGETTPASCLPPDAAAYVSTQEAEFTGWLHNYTTRDHGHCYNLVLAENDKERAKQGTLTRHKAATSYKPPRKRPASERPEGCECRHAPAPQPRSAAAAAARTTAASRLTVHLPYAGRKLLLRACAADGLQAV
jgi:hypothetical protein